MCRQLKFHIKRTIRPCPLKMMSSFWALDPSFLKFCAQKWSRSLMKVILEHRPWSIGYDAMFGGLVWTVTLRIMFEDVVCANKPKAGVQSQTHKWDREVQPFERIHLDWAYIKGIGELLIIIDAYSAWLEAILCQNRSSETVLRVLKTIFARLEYLGKLWATMPKNLFPVIATSCAMVEQSWIGKSANSRI